MDATLRVTDPYVFYYAESEQIDGTNVQRLIGYDEKNKKKDVLSVRKGKSGKEIVAIAKSKNYLWYCQKCKGEKYEIVKANLYGKQKKIVAEAKFDVFNMTMWANDQNAYVVTGEELYRIDLEGKVHKICESLWILGESGMITDSFFAIVNNEVGEAVVRVMENETQMYDEYRFELQCVKGKKRFYYEKLCSWGIFDGKVSVITVLQDRRRNEFLNKLNLKKFSSPTLYVLDEEQGEMVWKPYPMSGIEGFMNKPYINNTVFAHGQTDENHVFVLSGPVESSKRIINMEASLYDIKAGKQKKLCKTKGRQTWTIRQLDADENVMIARGERTLYVRSVGDELEKIIGIDLETGEHEIILNSEYLYWMDLQELGKFSRKEKIVLCRGSGFGV